MLNIPNKRTGDSRQVPHPAVETDPLSIRSNSNRNKPLHTHVETMCGAGKARWRIADNKDAFDLYQLIGDFCNWYDRVLDQNGHHLTARVSSDLPRFFHGHLLMLGFLLWDIASCSQAYLGSGDVVLEVHSERLRDNWYSIYFSFSVPGPGIPQQKEKLLFLPSDRTRKNEGGNSTLSNLYYAGIIAGLLGGILRVQNRECFGVEYIAEVCLLNSPSDQKEEF